MLRKVTKEGRGQGGVEMPLEVPKSKQGVGKMAMKVGVSIFCDTGPGNVCVGGGGGGCPFKNDCYWLKSHPISITAKIFPLLLREYLANRSV